MMMMKMMMIHDFSVGLLRCVDSCHINAGESWAPDITKLQLVDRSSGEDIGTLYLDLHTRWALARKCLYSAIDPALVAQHTKCIPEQLRHQELNFRHCMHAAAEHHVSLMLYTGQARCRGRGCSSRW